EHRGARAYEPAAHALRLGLDVVEAARERALFDRALDGCEKDRQAERLRQVVERTVAHRADGAFAVAVGGRNDDRHVAVETRPHRGQQLDPIAVAKPDVEEHATAAPLLQHATRGADPRGRPRLVTEALHGPNEPLAKPRLVLHDEDRAHTRTSLVRRASC